MINSKLVAALLRPFYTVMHTWSECTEYFIQEGPTAEREEKMTMLMQKMNEIEQTLLEASGGLPLPDMEESYEICGVKYLGGCHRAVVADERGDSLKNLANFVPQGWKDFYRLILLRWCIESDRIVLNKQEDNLE